MFSGVHYVTVDYMVYIQDGWITFAYWKPQFVSHTKEKYKEKDNPLNSAKEKSNYKIKKIEAGVVTKLF